MAASIRAFFKARPLVANCITYGSLYMGAEFSQQTLLRLDHLFTCLACERSSVVAHFDWSRSHRLTNQNVISHTKRSVNFKRTFWCLQIYKNANFLKGFMP